MPSEKIVYIESNQIPLDEVPYGDIKANLIDRTTGKPYRGIVLEGVFADLNDTPNNNSRIYDIPQYLELLRKLKDQIHSPRGVYGELEHPDKYSINYNNVSHKLLDVWYEEETKLVKGRLILLDTEKGKIAQNIVKSGGQLAISARAAGDEIDLPDGTKRAVVKILTTYDIVYHPGFKSAILEFKELNESENFIQKQAAAKTGFSMILRAKDLPKLNEHYINYLKLDNLSEQEKSIRRSMCFYEYLLFESEQEKQQQKMLEQNKPTDEQQKQNQLKKAVDKQLSESEKFYRKANLNLAKTYFDNSAGFINTEITSQGGYVDSYTI